MVRILVLGGYGGFGGRLSLRLAARGHMVMVAGRDQARAAAFCRGIDGAVPLRADRTGDLAPILAAHRPDVVIDAAGPFQGGSYAVPHACVAAGVGYLDLADARDFVGGIAALDTAARAAGVAVVAGASSVPALSGAVARRLAEGLDRVSTVDIAISASNRATAGRSVAAAMLGYAGRPIRLWRGGRWTRGHGWRGLRRQDFAVAGAPPLRRRWLATADVPDHDLLPARLPGRPATRFRAGTEHAHQTLGLWLLSWLARLSGVALTPLAPLLRPVQRIGMAISDDRSAMEVRLCGMSGAALVERRWTLIAEDGDGPEIPTLAAVLVAEAIARGEITPGARDAGELLALDDFAPLLAELAVRCEIVARDLPPPLYARVMGVRFDALPPAVRAIHRICRDAGAEGEAVVERGRNPVARLIGRVMCFPPAGAHALHVGFAEDGGVELWTRDFGGTRFSSRLGADRAGRLVERFGPLAFRFDLPSDADGLAMRMTGWSAFGLPLPLALAPRSPAREWQDGEGRFRFDVPIALPLVGLVVRYSGWLRPL